MFRTLPLTSLNIFICKQADDEAIAEVAAYPTLEKLSLVELPLTDAALEHLAKCKTLKSLSMSRIKFSEAALGKLAASQPSYRVECDGRVVEP